MGIAVQRIFVSSIHSITLCCAALCLVQLIIMSSAAAASSTSGALHSGSATATASDVAVVADLAGAVRGLQSVIDESRQHIRSAMALTGIESHQLQQQQQLDRDTGEGAAASAAAAVTSAGLTGGASGDSAAGTGKKRRRAAAAAASRISKELEKLAERSDSDDDEADEGEGEDDEGEGEEEEEDSTRKKKAKLEAKDEKAEGEQETKQQAAADSKKPPDQKQPDFSFIKAGNHHEALKQAAQMGLAALEVIDAGKIKGEPLYTGPLPESKRGTDPHRTQFDIMAMLNSKFLNEHLRGQLKNLVNESEATFRKQLKTLHVDVDQLHMVVLKLLVTEPGAAAQEVHLDVVKDAHKCWGVLLHCTATDVSTRLPSEPKDIAKLRAVATQKGVALDVIERCIQIKKDLGKHFYHQNASAGDALFFKTDVAHYGPAVPAGEPKRIMLYALFSKSKNQPDADKKQIQPFSHLKKLLQGIQNKATKETEAAETRGKVLKETLDQLIEQRKTAQDDQAKEIIQTKGAELAKEAEELKKRKQDSSTTNARAGELELALEKSAEAAPTAAAAKPASPAAAAAAK